MVIWGGSVLYASLCFLIFPELIFLLMQLNCILKQPKQALNPGTSGSELSPPPHLPIEHPREEAGTSWVSVGMTPSALHPGVMWCHPQLWREVRSQEYMLPEGRALWRHHPEAAWHLGVSQMRSESAGSQADGWKGCGDGNGLCQLVWTGPRCHPAGQGLGLCPGIFLIK